MPMSKVMFELSNNGEFRVANEDQRKKMINSSIRAREMFLMNFQGLSVSIVNTTHVEKSKSRKGSDNLSCPTASLPGRGLKFIQHRLGNPSN